MTDAAGPEPLERELLLAMLDLPAHAREAFLDKACGANLDLKERVRQLVRSAEESDSFMELPAVDLHASAHRERVEVGAQIGRYRLMEQIGEGGMGLVFVAEQTEPIARRVALKVIKPGMDSKLVIARFEAERQALALMDHPHISRVLDAGTTPSGLPYFVMELVRGMTITKYCDQAKVGVADRLRLFQDVCDAVQHAHQKGIIHRDLKPSNILVTLHDGKPVVKVIDFGVAKALHQTLTQKTIYTALNQVLGTPHYMSPEQLELSGLDIDTRSDIYSLGVLLYELLAGTLPFDRERLITSGFDEMRRIIREEEPPRPSQRVTTLPAATRSTVAEMRGLDHRELFQKIKNELDWITLKSLSKDRSRRYSSASEFAADIQRYLDDVPVLACPPSYGYLATKFIRKHRATIVPVVLLAASLVIGTIVSIQQAIRASSAEREAGIRLKELTIEQTRTNEALTAYKAAEATQRELRVEAERSADVAKQAAENEKTLREQIEASRREAEWNLYVAKLGNMQTAFDEQNFGRLRTLLRESEPKPGESDFRGWEWRFLWHCTTLASSRLLSADNHYPYRIVAYSPTSHELAAYGFPNFIEIWDPDKRTRLRRFPCDAPFEEVRWSPDGKYIAYGVANTLECVVLDSRDGTVVWRCQPLESRQGVFGATTIGGLSWHSNSQRLAIGSKFGDIATVNIVDQTTSILYHADEEESLQDISWHPADDRILVGMRGGKRLIIDTSNKSRQSLEDLGDYFGVATAWSPSGKVLATSEGSKIRIATDAGQAIAELSGHTASVTDLEWVDDRQLISSSIDHSIRLWNIDEKSQKRTWFITDAPIYDISVSRDKRHFATGTNHAVQIVGLDPYESVQTQDLASYRGAPYAVQWSPDGSMIYAVGERKISDTIVGVSTLADGATLRPLRTNIHEPSRGFSWTPNSRLVLLGLAGDQFKVGDPRTTMGWQRIPNIPFFWPTAVWSPDGSRVITHGEETPLILRNGRTGEILHEWSKYRTHMTRGEWSPSGTGFLASGQGYPIVAHIDGRAEQVPDNKAWHNYGISWHFSERVFAVGNENGEIAIRDGQSLKPVHTFKAHFGEIMGLDFSPDGRRLVSAGTDGTVCIWDVATGMELLRLKVPGVAQFSHVAWSPDGQQLMAATDRPAIVLFGPAGTNIAAPPSAIPQHGTVFRHFVSVSESDKFERAVPAQLGRTSQPRLKQIVADFEQGNSEGAIPEPASDRGTSHSASSQETRGESLREWLEAASDQSDLFNDRIKAIIRVIDGHRNDRVAIDLGEAVLLVLPQFAEKADRRNFLRWQNELRFALVHRIASTADQGKLVAEFGRAREAESQYATEFERDADDWYRCLSLETMFLNSVVTRYLVDPAKNAAADPPFELPRLLSDYQELLEKVPIEMMPLQAPVNFQSTQDEWFQNVSTMEIRRNQALTFKSEWPASISRMIMHKAQVQLYYFLGLSQLFVGDKVGHEATCHEMLKRFSGTTDPLTAALVTWTISLAPATFSEYDAALKLYQGTSANDLIGVELGALHFRMGEYERAREVLMRLVEMEKQPTKIEVAYFMALVELKLGNRESAADWAKQADSLVGPLITNAETRLQQSWPRLAQWELLQQELHQLLQDSSDE